MSNTIETDRNVHISEQVTNRNSQNDRYVMTSQDVKHQVHNFQENHG